MRFVPNTDQDRKEMLEFLGIKSIKELFKNIPEELLLKKNLKIPKGLSEIELVKEMRLLSEKNADLEHYSCFLGAGAYHHFIPSIIPHLIGRSEFYTSYTPYQPEASQGLLQTIYEFQTLICELTGMNVANASMYDGASALAEAMIMAFHITGREEIIISRTIHPEYREVVGTYARTKDLKIIEVGYENGITSLEALKEKVSNKTAAVLIQNPNFFGSLENLKEIEEITHKNKSLFIVAIVEPTSLGLLKPPGEFGADIVVGEGQSFGNPISFGGPYLGFMVTKDKYMRKLPGRLVGVTTDSKGRRGYILTLQTREQHIRRERATSNICTNEALCALAATIYLVSLGKEGLRKAAELSTQKAHYAFERIKGVEGFGGVFSSPFYNEFVVKYKNAKKINQILLKEKIIGPLELERYYPELKNHLLFCATEMNSREEIDRLVNTLKEIK
ncbi:MAG TPA: aminomethyl-transferring glycine dehydrogenase subunit GcvPA [bacterium]|nr:aminomethyl-transferring glycine dehydrogenase subunit GcvPA [bacterium]